MQETKTKPSALTRIAPPLFVALGIVALMYELAKYCTGTGSLAALLLEPTALFAVAWEARRLCRRHDNDEDGTR